MKLLLSCMLCIAFFISLAQKGDKTVREYLPTENLSIKKNANKPANRPDKKNIALIYTKDANKILYGNPCAMAETHRMGFEYILEPKNGMGSKTQKGKFFNNLLVKIKLLVTRSPFWKVILNKRIENCRQQTGDFVG